MSEDFPNYQLEASVVKNIEICEKIGKAFELYHTVVLPTHLNHEWEFLEKVLLKDREQLGFDLDKFLGVGCSRFKCPRP